MSRCRHPGSVDLARLRDRTWMTETAVLFLLHADPTLRLTGVADRLEVTVQAVSNYAKALAADGLLAQDEGSGAYRVTAAGVEALHDRVGEVKRIVDGAYRRLSVVTETTAMAGEAICEGDPVGLVMEDGLLVAYPDRDASSTGTAATSASAGEIVAVSDLDGILDIRPGRIHLVRVPADPAAQDLGASALAEFLDRRGITYGRVAGLGTEAKLLARTLDAPLLEFAPVDAAFEAAQLGLDVLLLSTTDQLKTAVATLEFSNEDAPARVRYSVHEDLAGS